MDQGLLVPDELTCDLVTDRIGQDDCKKGFILDGFPRTINQAEALTDALGKKGQQIDYAVNVIVSDEKIVSRMSGRRVCPKCGASYHLVTLPPKAEGICDKCGSELTQRADDDAETVKKRLNIYHEQTEPLEKYYSEHGVLYNVDGTKDMDEVFESIRTIVGN